MKVSELILRCAKDFGDYDEDGATDDEKYSEVKIEDWLDYYNSALRQLVIVRPDSHVKTVQHKLTAGETIHSIPSDADRLIDIPRNMGTDGSTPGVPVRKIDRDVIEDFHKSWHSDDGDTVIEFYAYDPKNPTKFWVYPRAHSTLDVYVDLQHPYPFSEVAIGNITTTDVEPDENFLDALGSWMLKRAYDLDTDSQVNSAESVKHEQAFYNQLGIEFQAGGAISSKKAR